MLGYYEWSEELENGKTVKQPHFLQSTGSTLAAAGIYTARKVGDEWVLSTAIITREARDASGAIHDRMPAFLTPEFYDQWLSPEKLATETDRESLLSLLDVISTHVASTITSYEVDRRVNSTQKVDPLDPTLIAPLEPGADDGDGSDRLF